MGRNSQLIRFLTYLQAIARWRHADTIVWHATEYLCGRLQAIALVEADLEKLARPLPPVNNRVHIEPP